MRQEHDTGMVDLLEHAELTPARPPERSGLRLLAQLLLALVVLAALGGGVVLLSAVREPLAPSAFTGQGSGQATVRVVAGDSLSVVAAGMERAGVIASAQSFLELAAADPRATKLAPGTYQLRRSMGDAEALAMLLDPASKLSLKVTIPEGFTLAQTLERLAATTKRPLAEFEAAAKDTKALKLPAGARSAEGYLFPATYEADPAATPVQLLRQMVARYEQESKSLAIPARAEALGRTEAEIVTIASLIEAETPIPEDMGKVSRVVYNRLEASMPLQFDSTLNYVLPERKGRLTLEDLKLDSPYNSYTNKGLTPTPIGAPGRAALAAALEPAEGEWLYFVVVSKDGTSLFTEDYDEFLAAKKKSQAEGVY